MRQIIQNKNQERLLEDMCWVLIQEQNLDEKGGFGGDPMWKNSIGYNHYTHLPTLY